MITIDCKNVIYSFNSHNSAVAEIMPGERAKFITKDCFSNQLRRKDDPFSALDWATINPATGPLAIQGAAPGDTLKVTIEDIQIDTQGVMVTVPGAGALGHLIDKTEIKIISIEDNMAIFNDKIKLPVQPMIGVIGTAPKDEDIPCGTPKNHGGNMDTKLVQKGAILYLPVFVEGANLAMGDLHAVMGDGEVSVCGVEIAGEVIVKVDLIKGQSQPWPILEDSWGWYVIASAQDLDEASQLALDAMMEFLKPRLPLSINDIVSLLSIAGNLEISQVVDPLKTVRMGISKDVVKAYDFGF